MIWGEGRRKLGEDLKVLYDNGYQGLISQELTMGKTTIWTLFPMTSGTYLCSVNTSTEEGVYV